MLSDFPRGSARMPDSIGRTADVLRQTTFARFLGARLLSTLAAQAQSVAVGYQIYEVTRDPLDLGLVGLSQFLPFVVLVLPAGQLADRLDRSKVLCACYMIGIASAGVLLWYTLQGISVAWPVFTAMVLFGCARAFAMPSGQALLPNLVPPEQFSRAVALNSWMFQLAMVLGPALGGMLYSAGPRVVYMSVMGLGVISLLLMIGVRPLNAPAPAAKEPAGWKSLLSGLHFVASRPVVLGAISLDLFAVLFGGATALLPIFASDVLHVGAGGLGWLRAANGIGAAACALVLAFTPITRGVGAWMFGGVAVFGAATVVFAVSTSFVLTMAVLMVLGAADMVSVYIRHLLVQLATPDYIRGRVSAVNSVFIGASNELGEFESGVTAKWLGTVRAAVLGGALTLIVTGVWIRLFPTLWRMDKFGEPVRS
jgi:MFS family permease